MSLYAQYSTDKALEKEGIIWSLGPNSKGDPMGIRLARAGGGNSAYQRVWDAVTKPYRRQLQLGTLDKALERQLQIEIYVKSVIKDFENLEDAEGNPLEFNEENATQLFLDLPELFEELVVQANNFSLFRQEILEEDTKN